MRNGARRGTGAEAKAALIPVIELFGPTVQGEGMAIGQKRCSSARPAATTGAAGAIPRSHGTVPPQATSG
ncbi:hypothetical protein PACILC2_43280 [Paenibacillus cisolokensis]|uniref:Uncharacterized protein n=1 Tax=Paenibacillus cisolokensis TaxID=1658519 RepID=A0ABQ4NC13_9BACL|nr:hypothetical protein PACILC2_43280 [Paenibacillus cisolokensis]